MLFISTPWLACTSHNKIPLSGSNISVIPHAPSKLQSLNLRFLSVYYRFALSSTKLADITVLCVVCCSEEQLKKTEPPGDNTRDQLKHAPWFQAGIPRYVYTSKSY